MWPGVLGMRRTAFRLPLAIHGCRHRAGAARGSRYNA